MNKPILSNLLALAVLLFSFVDTPVSGYCFSVGMFALSGGITNWLAIHMLFEKIPFIVGSGVIEIQFEEFKKGIRQLILQEFFNRKNIETIYGDLHNEAVSKINLSFNKDEIFPINEPVIAFFNSFTIKFAVPSAVFKAIFPVNPSEIITFILPSII